MFEGGGGGHVVEDVVYLGAAAGGDAGFVGAAPGFGALACHEGGLG